jgi:hypothetical protein
MCVCVCVCVRVYVDVSADMLKSARACLLAQTRQGTSHPQHSVP